MTGRKCYLQIGKKGVFDSSDGTVNGTPLNASASQFFRVSEIGFDPHNGDIYVADGHAKGKGGNNFRIVVFDRTGKYLRQWKLHRSAEEANAARPTPHCVRVSNDGIVYVCDRWMNRLQLFDTMGNFKKTCRSSTRCGLPRLNPEWSAALRCAGWIMLFGRVLTRSGREVHVRDQRNRRGS